MWRYPEEEYYQDCIVATHINGFEKVKIWGALRYGKLSEGIIMKEKEGAGKLMQMSIVLKLWTESYLTFG